MGWVKGKVVSGRIMHFAYGCVLAHKENVVDTAHATCHTEKRWETAISAPVTVLGLKQSRGATVVLSRVFSTGLVGDERPAHQLRVATALLLHLTDRPTDRRRLNCWQDQASPGAHRRDAGATVRARRERGREAGNKPCVYLVTRKRGSGEHTHQ